MKQTRSVPPRAADVLRELDFISRTTVLFLFCMNLDVIILQHWLYFFNYGKIYLQYIYIFASPNIYSFCSAKDGCGPFSIDLPIK